jgi:hypothetical protein
MLTDVLKTVKMLLSCCPKNSQDVVVLATLKTVQDAEKNHPYKDQVQRLIPINPMRDLLLYRAHTQQHISLVQRCNTIQDLKL